MEPIVGFFRFWYDFIVGDDWVIAALIAITLIVLKLLNNGALWWILPVVVIAVLGGSLWRATRTT